MTPLQREELDKEIEHMDWQPRNRRDPDWKWQRRFDAGTLWGCIIVGSLAALCMTTLIVRACWIWLH